VVGDAVEQLDQSAVAVLGEAELRHSYRVQAGVALGAQDVVAWLRMA
jgi:hypothetical protein